MFDASPRAKVLACPASPRFMAILDYALACEVKRVKPVVTSLTVTSDGYLMLRHTDLPYKDGFVGVAASFDENLRGICAYVELSEAETEEVLAEAYSRITDWRAPAERKGTSPYSKKAS